MRSMQWQLGMLGTVSAFACHEIWEPQPTGTLKACPGIALSFTAPT